MNVLGVDVSFHFRTSSLSCGNFIFASLQFCLFWKTSVPVAELQMLP